MGAGVNNFSVIRSPTRSRSQVLKHRSGVGVEKSDSAYLWCMCHAFVHFFACKHENIFFVYDAFSLVSSRFLHVGKHMQGKLQSFHNVGSVTLHHNCEHLVAHFLHVVHGTCSFICQGTSIRRQQSNLSSRVSQKTLLSLILL